MPIHILVIDDDANSRALLKGMLEHLDYTVATAGNGAEALEEIARQRPDLMLLDLMMPRMSGFELMGHMRGQAQAQIPIVILSSLATPSTRMDQLPGVVGALRKGAFTLTDIQNIIEKVTTPKPSQADTPQSDSPPTPRTDADGSSSAL